MTNRAVWLGLVLGWAAAGGALPMAGQGMAGAARPLATREDLQAVLASGQGPRGKITARERQEIEDRLTNGDFKPADQVILRVNGEATLTGTFAVTAGPEVALPNLDPLPLRGVLRSELQMKAQEHVARFLREPQVQAESMIRVGVLGAVARPGYYNISPALPVSEVLMAAGGLVGTAELKKTTVVREGAEHWSRDEVRQAMARGISLDEFGMQSGDELTVGAKGAGLGGTLPIVTGVVTLSLTILTLVLTK